MSNSVVTNIILGFLGFFMVTLCFIVGWGIREWLKDQREKAKEEVAERKSLRSSVDGLKSAIAHLSEKFVLKTDYDRDMAIFRITGRRSTDLCDHPDCPLTNPGKTNPGIQSQS